MPEISQLNFNFREIAEYLLKREKIKSGKWSIGVSFNFGVGNMGPTPAEAKPGVLMTVENITLLKVDDNSVAEGLIIDAGQLAAIAEEKKPR
jgi:hypothetical protein